MKEEVIKLLKDRTFLNKKEKEENNSEKVTSKNGVLRWFINTYTTKKMKFFANEEGLIGGVIYVVTCVGLSLILILTLGPVMDSLCVVFHQYVPTPGSSWERAAISNEKLVVFWYKTFIFMAINGLLYVTLTPLKRMMDSRFRPRRYDYYE